MKPKYTTGTEYMTQISCSTNEHIPTYQIKHRTGLNLYTYQLPNPLPPFSSVLPTPSPKQCNSIRFSVLCVGKLKQALFYTDGYY